MPVPRAASPHSTVDHLSIGYVPLALSREDLADWVRNAIMFNAKGTPVHDMAVEMMQDSEEHIRHLKSVQRHMGR